MDRSGLAMSAIGRRIGAAPGLSLRHTRAGVLVHDKVIREGVVPALQAAETRVLALEQWRDLGLLGRLSWLLTGKTPPIPKVSPDAV
jgi:hypothetical protein